MDANTKGDTMQKTNTWFDTARFGMFVHCYAMYHTRQNDFSVEHSFDTLVVLC